MAACCTEGLREAMSKFIASLRCCILTRRSNNHEPGANGASCDIEGKLADKRTFFAWQRNHMANERTFLAWCRTGISLIVFAFVIERFDLLIRELQVFSSRPELQKSLRATHHMGLVVFILGAVIIFLAGWRFFYIRRHINRGESDFSALPDMFLLGSVLVTVLITFLFFVFLF